MEYNSAIKRNTFESGLMRWMKLEPIIQSEVSQKEKDKYCMYTNTYIWYLENCTEECLQGSNGEADIENRLLTQRDGRRGWEELREDTFYHLLLYLWRL